MKKFIFLSAAVLLSFSVTVAQDVIISGEAMYNSNFSIINSSITGTGNTKKQNYRHCKKINIGFFNFYP